MKSLLFHTAILSLIACIAMAQGAPAETPAASESAKEIAPRGKRKKVVREVSPKAATVVEPVPDAAKEAGQEKIAKDVFPRFSVLGDWVITHPLWTDVATIHQDGTVTTKRQGTAGRWFLAGDGGTPLVVIRWELFGTESVGMVDLDHFRGQTRSGRYIDMRRRASASE